MGKKLLTILASVFVLILLTGCWDRVEIEDRGFVVGVAIDLPDQEQSEEDKRNIKFELTAQLVVPSASQSSQSSAGGGESGSNYVNVSAIGRSMHEANSKLSASVSRTPFYAHNAILIVSEKVARSGHFSDVIDFFLRSQEMRRETKVMIAKDKEAKEFFSIETKMDQLPAVYLNSVAENDIFDIDIPKPVRMGDLHQKLLVNSSFAIPAITIIEERANVASSAIFRGQDNLMVDSISGEDNEGLQLLKGLRSGGALNVNLKDNLVVYKSDRVSRKISADVSDIENIKFTVLLETFGTIVESMETTDYLEEVHVWELLEQKTEEQIELIAIQTLDHLHGELEVDVIDLDRHLYANHPEVWEKVREDWDKGKNYFAMSEIDIHAHVQIRNAGVVNQTEPKNP